jgi:hypothetical protein
MGAVDQLGLGTGREHQDRQQRTPFLARRANELEATPVRKVYLGDHGDQAPW